MHLWRNRQTRQIQVLVGATRCRFDSCQVHQKRQPRLRTNKEVMLQNFAFRHNNSLKVQDMRQHYPVLLPFLALENLVFTTQFRSIVKFLVSKFKMQQG